MKINWKVRLCSGPFWVGAASAFLVFLYALCSLLGVQLPVAQAEVLNVVLLLLSFLAAVGIISDPTTPGVEDSRRALAYKVPGGEDTAGE